MKGFSTAGIALVVVALAFFGGVYVGNEYRPAIDKVAALTGKEPSVVFEDDTTDFSPFWQTWNVINEKFATPDVEDLVSDQDKVWGSIQGLVASLDDPYSVFLPPVEAELFEENIAGNFGGVGMEVGIRDGILTVIAPLKDTPAERAGIIAGDIVIQVDDTVTAEMAIDEAVSLIRGEVGTPVVLTVLREGEDEPLEITIVRDVISIPTLTAELRDDGVFFIELYQFTSDSPRLFSEALQEFSVSGSNKLLLDLRSNPGGLLDAAVTMASWFLPAGKVVVSEDFGGKKETIFYRSHGYDVFNEGFGLEMAILINQGSASASEILAGALSEHGIATLVGTQSFGKGSVQELVPITNETSLKITVAHWKTPEGTILSDEGLVPDIEVERTVEDVMADRDPQVEAAIEFLLGQ